MKTNLLEQTWICQNASLHTSEIRTSGLSINVNSRGDDGRKILEISREHEIIAQLSLDPAACAYLARLLTDAIGAP